MRSRACDPARHSDGSQTRNWARRIFLNGEINDARDGMPARTRPCVRISTRGAIGAHLYADTCLRSRFAGDAPSIGTAATAVIAAAVATVAVSRPPFFAAAPPSSDMGGVAASCTRERRAGQRSQAAGLSARWVFFRSRLRCVLMGEGRAGQKRICTLWDTSACLLMLLRSPIGPRVHETAKIGVACSCGIIPCGKSCCIPLRGPKRTLFCLNLTQVREYDYPKLCPHHRPADLQGLCELR